MVEEECRCHPRMTRHNQRPSESYTRSSQPKGKEDSAYTPACLPRKKRTVILLQLAGTGELLHPHYCCLSGPCLLSLPPFVFVHSSCFLYSSRLPGVLRGLQSSLPELSVSTASHCEDERRLLGYVQSNRSNRSGVQTLCGR